MRLFLAALLRGELPRDEHPHDAHRLPEPGAATAPVLTDDEQGSILGLRWWTPQELAGTDERFFPRHVPALLPRLLAGERVEEPFDTWD